MSMLSELLCAGAHSVFITCPSRAIVDASGDRHLVGSARSFLPHLTTRNRESKSWLSAEDMVVPMATAGHR